MKYFTLNVVIITLERDKDFDISDAKVDSLEVKDEVSKQKLIDELEKAIVIVKKL